MTQKPKLMTSYRHLLIGAGYAESTIRDYCRWVHRFIHFHQLRHPKDLGAKEVGQFITHIATDLEFSSQSQNKALCAIVFLYRKLLLQPLGDIDNLVWSRAKQRFPIFYSPSEIAAILQELNHPYWLIVSLGFGAGLRISETLNLRVKHVDFQRQVLRVVQGKFNKDREVDIPNTLLEPLSELIERRKQQFDSNQQTDSPFRKLIGKARDYPIDSPEHVRDCYLFVHDLLYVDHKRQVFYHKPYTRQSVDKALKNAMRATHLNIAGFHALRHSYATACLAMGVNIRELQQNLGHSCIKTTQIYTHFRTDALREIKSPLDKLF